HYGESQLNRATDARRQPGSVYKPFVYAAALEGGISPVTLFADAPREFTYDVRSKYRPANYGNSYAMRDVMLRTGLIKSLNVVTVDAAMRAGLPRVAALVERFGLAKPEPYPSLALGTSEATPLEIASAYTAFANGGTRARPVAVSHATDAGGLSLIAESAAPAETIIRPATAYMITDMLTGVINEGTARAARGMLKGTAVAGKTGTSRDGWFAGYTPHLVCVVWVGFDDNEQLGLTGAESALPVWSEFMKGTLELRPELGGAAFMRPSSITTVEIDPETGLRASPTCPHREHIAVTSALAPGTECYTHQQPLEMVAYNDVPLEEIVVLEESADHDAVTVVPRTQSSTGESTGAVRVPALRAVPVAAKSTRVEASTNGRPRLTNEIKIEDDSSEP
ncbi:MAG: hypothetical protein H0T45_09170, partial [Pyrinomonadaceae bacterium]|nr:hypothetical protein [Pyrinomonadaceae bacterium]